MEHRPESVCVPDEWLHDLLSHVDELTRQLDDARRLALPAFTSPEGDLSEHTHVLDDQPPRIDYPDDRPSAYDMPVGSVVVAHDYSGNLRTLTCRIDYENGDEWSDGVAPDAIRSGWIEGLFSDGLVTEWRLP
jgi:hypothetical protein